MTETRTKEKSYNDGELLSKALLLAVNSHKGQYDKSGMPYVLHPLKVMHYLKSDDEELQCIALLHDVVEDCGVTYEQLYELGFTERIVNGIRNLTKATGESYREYKAKAMSTIDSMLVKRADLRHNSDIRRLKGVGQKDIERTIRYHNFYLEIEDKLREIRGELNV